MPITLRAHTLWSAVLVALMVMPSSADVFIREKRHTDAFSIMGRTKPAQDQEITYWVGKNRLRSNGPDDGALVLLDENRIVLIDHTKRQYTEIPKDIFEGGDSSKELPRDMPESAREMMKMEVRVEATGETKRIRDWRCRKYIQRIDMAMGSIVSQLWATEDIDIPPELFARFLAAYQSRTRRSSAMIGSKVEEMKKVKGFVVKSSTTAHVMNSKIGSTSEVVEVKQDVAAREGTYEVPRGYREVQWQ